MELPFWHAVALVNSGRIDEALPIWPTCSTANHAGAMRSAGWRGPTNCLVTTGSSPGSPLRATEPPRRPGKSPMIPAEPRRTCHSAAPTVSKLSQDSLHDVTIGRRCVGQMAISDPAEPQHAGGDTGALRGEWRGRTGHSRAHCRARVMKTPLPDGERNSPERGSPPAAGNTNRRTAISEAKPRNTVLASLAATGGNGDLASAVERRFAATER